MTVDVAEATRTFVAMLTAHVHGTPLDCGPLLAELNAAELVYILNLALGMLAHEVRLGCADSGIAPDEYLAMLGQSVA